MHLVCQRLPGACIRHVKSEDDRLPLPQISHERGFPCVRQGAGVALAWLFQAEIACGLALQIARPCRRTLRVGRLSGSLCDRAASKLSGDEAYYGAAAGRLR